MSDKRSINIQVASSAQGLKEEIKKFADQRAMNVSKVVCRIYEYAANNPNSFPSKIDTPRPKPGKHISAQVSQVVCDKLTQAAKNNGRSRSQHCCFLLEGFMSKESLQNDIFKN